MAVTQSQIDALIAAYAAGTVRVTYDGKTVEYRDLDALARAIGTLSAALGVANPLTAAVTARPRFSFAAFRK